MKSRLPPCTRLSLFFSLVSSLPFLPWLLLPLPPPSAQAIEGVMYAYLCPCMGVRRNDLVLNFNNTFSQVLQSTSNQGLNWICNVCSVTHKSLTHQTDSLRASKQMSVCETCLWAVGIVCITANTAEVFKFWFFRNGFWHVSFPQGEVLETSESKCC